MNSKSYITVLLLTLTTFGWAQPSPVDASGAQMTFASRQVGRGTVGAPPSDAFIEGSLFAPEVIMQNQRALGLTSEQQTALRGQMETTMPRFTELQWQQGAAIEAMAALLKKEKPDEEQVLAELDKLLRIENDIKRLHTRLLVRIKSTLTPEQQAWLREQMTQLPNVANKPDNTRAVTVMGKVNRGGPVELPSGQKITLLEAIARAGGFSPLANKNKIQLNRGGKISYYRFSDLVGVTDLEKQVFAEPGDVIYVHESFF
jgi:Spy/CpxP family protein refolding chaperone